MTVPTEGCDQVRLELALLEGSVDVTLLASDDEAQWSLIGERCTVEGPSCSVLPRREVAASVVRVDLRARGARAVVTGGGLRLERQ
jgi:hypothetical protein